MFCNQCGKELAQSSNFCQHCGSNANNLNSQATPPTPIVKQPNKSVDKGGNSTTKILKMIGATILLLVALQYLVSIFTAIFVAIFGANTEQSYTNVRAIAILISFGIIIYLWIRGYKSIFKK